MRFNEPGQYYRRLEMIVSRADLQAMSEGKTPAIEGPFGFPPIRGFESQFRVIQSPAYPEFCANLTQRGDITLLIPLPYSADDFQEYDGKELPLSKKSKGIGDHIAMRIE
ncbi:MAG: hypothetical protein ABIH34_03205 [Nanoarchaeota archaeon]